MTLLLVVTSCTAACSPNKNHRMGPDSTVLEPEGSFILWLNYTHQYVMSWIARSDAGETVTADCCCM
jgi:hypothetical protein